MVRSFLNLDMDVLRTFVVGMEGGSFAKAAEQLGRSPSAISLQLRKLEVQVGQPLVRKQGRHLALTEAGETLIGYARRILDLNDEARMALDREGALEGWVRIGVPQDFAETWLPDLLARFERAHPKVRVEVRVERGSAMVEAVRSGELDVALTWGRLNDPDCEVVARRDIVWIGCRSGGKGPREPLRLVAFDPPCTFRTAATAALDAAGLEWRHAFASPSLSGLWAAVTAGLGVTARTVEGMPNSLQVLEPEGSSLPRLGPIELAIHVRPGRASPLVLKLKDLLVEAIDPSVSKSLPILQHRQRAVIVDEELKPTGSDIGDGALATLPSPC